MIIDTHVHMGYDEAYESLFAEEANVKGMQDNGVDVSIVQPGTTMTLEGARQQHDEIARFIKEHPGRAFGMANPNPHLPGAVYREELLRCVRDLHFVAVKINGLAYGVKINGKASGQVYELAQELDITVMIHTGAGGHFASALNAIPVARNYPRLRLVLAHSGSGTTAEESLAAAEACPNIYLETSWSTVLFLPGAIRRIGAHRLLFGSDHAENIPVELAKHRALGLSDGELDLCLGGTAAKAFKLPLT